MQHTRKSTQKTTPDFKTEAPSVLKLAPVTADDLAAACVAGLQLLSLRSRGLHLADFAPSTRAAMSAARRNFTRSNSTPNSAA